MATGEAAARILPGRGCGTCTLCCKVLGIKALDKPQGQWCPHCEVGRGCSIYSDRPTECARFNCGYLTWSQLSEDWKPSRSKLVVVLERQGTRIAIYVDPARADAWRTQPYYADIKRWAVGSAARGHQVVVMIDKRAIVILPDHDSDLGVLDDEDVIVTRPEPTPAGTRLRAYSMRRDDPTATRMGVILRR